MAMKKPTPAKCPMPMKKGAPMPPKPFKAGGMVKGKKGC